MGGADNKKEKDILRLICRVCCITIFPLLIIPTCIIMNPLKFLDEEASFYIENKDFENHHEEQINILIMGDSCAKAGWIPDLLGEDVYNYSLGGAGTIDEYFALKNYLEKNEAPEYVIYSISSWFFMRNGALWSRSAYFHRFSMKNFIDLKETAEEYPDYSVIGTEHILREYLSYQLYLPQNYSKAFFEGLASDERLETNTVMYDYVRHGRGHVLYGKAESYNEVTPFEEEHFEPNEILVDYLYRTIELCEDNDIKFIFQPAPLNPASYGALNGCDYMREYTFFLERIQEKYPDIEVETKVPMYEADCFGDVHHLNKCGAEKFTYEMLEKYNEVFK